MKVQHVICNTPTNISRNKDYGARVTDISVKNGRVTFEYEIFPRRIHRKKIADKKGK